MDESNDCVEIYQLRSGQGLSPAEAFGSITDELSAIYEEEGWANLRTTVKSLVDSCAETTEEAEVFIDGFFDITAGGGDIIDENDADFAEDLVRQFPDSMKFVEILARFYSELCGQDLLDTYLPKLAELSVEHPDMSSVALYYAQTLVSLTWDISTGVVSIQDYAEAVRLVKSLYEAYPRSEFAETYAEGLRHLAENQDCEEDAAQPIAAIEDLLVKWHNPYIANDYLSALTRLTWMQDEQGCAATIAKMESMWDGYPYPLETLAMNIAYALANYSLCLSGTEQESVIHHIGELAEWWKPAARMSTELRDGTYAYAHKPRKAA